MIKKLPKFYQEILCEFNECKTNPMTKSLNETMQQPIWNNRNFQYKGKTLFLKNWVTCGVLNVKNLINENCDFKAFYEYTDIENKSMWI